MRLYILFEQSEKIFRNLEDFDVVFVTALQEFRNWLTPWAMEAMHMVALETRLLDGWLVYVCKVEVSVLMAASWLTAGR
jgi:hypothetical protein